MSTFSPVFLLLLAVVFGWAAGSKLRDPAAFHAVLRKLAPSGAATLSVAVPLAEVALAVLLLVGWHARATAAVGGMMLVIFSAALVRMHRLHVGGCGCFGERASGSSVGRGLVRNGLLLTAAMWVVIDPPIEPVWHWGAARLFGATTVIVGLVCAWACATALLDSLSATRSAFLTVNR